MRVWRICKAEHAATAFSGEGAVAYAGRWHHAGTPVVYVSESRALTALRQRGAASDLERDKARPRIGEVQLRPAAGDFGLQ